MGVVSSFTRSFDALKNAPTLFAFALLYALVGSVSSVLQSFNEPWMSSLGTLWSLGVFAFVFPFFAGGLLTLAREGLLGEGELGDFLEGGVGNYLYMIGFTWIVGLVEFVWVLVVGFISYIVLIFVGIAAVFGFMAATGGGDAGGPITIVAIAIGVLLLLAFSVVFYLIGGIPVLVVQFVPGAYVIDDMDPIEGAKRGLRLLADNVLGALAFDLVIFVIGVVMAVVSLLPLAAAYFVLGPDAILADSFWQGGGFASGPGSSPGQGSDQLYSLTPLGIALSVVPGLFTSTVQIAIVAAFYATFYREISPGSH